MFGENIKLALKSFAASKMRTLLSLLGITIGVSSVIMITTLGNSATANIKEEIASGGMDIVAVFGGWGSIRSRQLFHPGLGQEINQAIPSVKTYTPLIRSSPLAKSPFKSASFEMNCINPSYKEIFNIEMARGRFFSREDALHRFPAAVLGNKTARTLFPTGNATGSSLKIMINGQAHALTVIGVMKKKDPGMGISFNNTILMDFNYYRSRIARVDVVESFFLKAASPTAAATTTKDVEDYLKERVNEKNAFWVESPSSVAKTFNKVSQTMNLVLACIAGISLLVGGIGIMNIMLVSVTERTREIGIRKALGAPQALIRGQFLTESAVLTLIGGILGILLGTGASRIITGILKWRFSPVIYAYGLSLGFSALIGVFFGFYPALRASRLDPVAALAHE